MLDIVLAHAAKAGASRVVRIYLVVGDLAGVVGDSVQFYFDFVSRDTPAAGAELVFTRVAARLRCKACGTEYEGEAVSRPTWACPACGAIQPEAIGGREFLVESIEVE
jgi:hydrogenase nickel incorporation protein HypA/HybF